MSVKGDDFDGDEDGNGDNAIWRAGEKRLFWQKDFQIEAFFEEKDCDDEDQK